MNRKEFIKKMGAAALGCHLTYLTYNRGNLSTCEAISNYPMVLRLWDNIHR